MRFFLEFDDEGNVRGGGLLPSTLEEADISIMFKSFIQTMNDLRAGYDVFIANDGRLIGEERFRILDGIDNAIKLLIIIRARFENKTEFTCIHVKYGFRVVFTIEEKAFRLSGFIGRTRTIQIRKFDDWVDKVLSEQIKETLQYYAAAVKDGVLDLDERTNLLRHLDKMIFGLMLAWDHIATGEMG